MEYEFFTKIYSVSFKNPVLKTKNNVPQIVNGKESSLLCISSTAGLGLDNFLMSIAYLKESNVG